MHLALGTDLFDSFERYQGSLIEEYRRLATEFAFTIADARRSIDEVQSDLRMRISEYLRRSQNDRHISALKD
jgi:thymidylate kinase